MTFLLGKVASPWHHCTTNHWFVSFGLLCFSEICSITCSEIAFGGYVFCAVAGDRDYLYLDCAIIETFLSAEQLCKSLGGL